MSTHAVRIFILVSPILSLEEVIGIRGILATKSKAAYIGGLVTRYEDIPYAPEMRIKIYTFISLSPFLPLYSCPHVHFFPSQRREKKHLFVDLGYTLWDNINAYFQPDFPYTFALAWAWNQCYTDTRKVSNDRPAKLTVSWLKKLVILAEKFPNNALEVLYEAHESSHTRQS